MVMAAGLGTRLRPFTEKTAKPLLPLMGVPMAQYAFDLLGKTSVDQIVANVHHLPTPSSQALRFLDHPGELNISDESELLLGSAGGIVKAAPTFKGRPFFIINADTVCSFPLTDLAKHHLYLRHHYSVRMTLLILKRAPGSGSYSEILIDDRRSLVRGLGEKKSGRSLYTGVAVIEPECLVNLEAGTPYEFVPTLLEPAIRAGKAGAYVFDNSIEPFNTRWFDIGSPELWHQAHLDWMRLYEDGELPTLWRDRLLKANRRLAPGIWASVRGPETIDITHWRAPCYWAPEETDHQPPKYMASGSIVYGRAPWSNDSAKPLSGIGYRGLWKTL